MLLLHSGQQSDDNDSWVMTWFPAGLKHCCAWSAPEPLGHMASSFFHRLISLIKENKFPKDVIFSRCSADATESFQSAHNQSEQSNQSIKHWLSAG